MNSKLSYKRLVYISLLSRIFYISIGTLSHYFIPHYDLSTSLNESSSIFDSLLKWDAVHFRDIALNGYLQEHTLAFFPLLPSIIRTFHFLVNNILLMPFSKYTIDLFTVGVILVNLIFIINSLLLYKLTLHIFDLNMATITFYLYIFNPASIICSTMYTETLFMLLFLISLFFLIKRREMECTLVLSLSILCRSNGILFALLLFRFRMFLVHLVVLCVPIGFQQLYCLSKILRFRIFHHLEDFLEIFPDQKYIFNLDENNILLKYKFKENILSVFDAKRISSSSGVMISRYIRLFIPYSYVQKEYWDQGFLRFFTLLNIPNVLVGLPFILFSFYSFLVSFESGRSKILIKALRLQLLVKSVLCLFFFHWNIYFRFISFNPIVYWSIAKMYLDGKHPLLFKLYLRYYFGFSVAYALLYGAFFPPA